MSETSSKTAYSEVAVHFGSSKLFLLAVLLYFLGGAVAFVRDCYGIVVKILNGVGVMNTFESIVYCFINALFTLFISKLLLGLYGRFKGINKDENRIQRVFTLTVFQSVFAVLDESKRLVSEASGATQWAITIGIIVLILFLLVIYILAVKKSVNFLASVIDGEPSGTVSPLLTIALLIQSLRFTVIPFIVKSFEITDYSQASDWVNGVLLYTVECILVSMTSILFLILTTKIKAEVKAVAKDYK